MHFRDERGSMPNFENRNQYLFVSPSEPYSLKGYKQAMSEAAAICQQHGLTRVLADIRCIEKCISIVDKYELGVHIAQTLGSAIRLAILAPLPMIDKVGENAAVNRGGRVLVTDNEGHAMEWLGVAA